MMVSFRHGLSGLLYLHVVSLIEVIAIIDCVAVKTPTEWSGFRFFILPELKAHML